MNATPATAGLLLGHLLVFPGCGVDVVTEESLEPKVTTCTLVGCPDNLGVVLVNPPFDSPGALPIEIEVCRAGDATCRHATVDYGETDVGFVPGRDCVVHGREVLCCEYAVGTFNSCDPIPMVGDRPPEIGMGLTLQEGICDGCQHTVSVLARTADGTVIANASGTVTLRANQPNGPECEPTCHQGGIGFECTVPR